jgi:hypothetical protein
MTELQEIFKVKQIFEKFDWFECVDIVDNNFIVYVNRMGTEVFNKVPDYINKRKVLIHFYASKMANKNVYTTSSYDEFNKNLEIQQFVKKNIHTYGKTVVGYVFYEIYNSNIEKTNSVKYPHLHEEITILCNKHGYLSLFKELELQGVL